MLLVAVAGLCAGLFTSAAVIIAVRSNDGDSVRSATGPVSSVGAGAPKSWPAWGLTHTQYTPDADSGFEQARAALSGGPVPQNQSLMGWGADNPEPSPGRFSFASLDKRIQFIRDTKGTPLITLCGAPDWMKGGRAGQTDWSKIETAPTRAHYDDFAGLAAETARRYPDVKYYAVWNEFKGFFSQSRNRWDYEGYTLLYNKVYAALKKVNPEIKVGGPYIPMTSNEPGFGPPTAVSGRWGSVDQRSLDAVSYWLKHKAGADFLAVDGSALPDQKGAKINEFDAVSKFRSVTEWLRARSGGKLPIWWAEWYVEPPGSGWTDEHRGALQAAATIEFIRGGAATALYWSPQTETSGDCPGCLWSGSGSQGKATPTLDMLQKFSRYFRSGTPLVRATAADPAVRVLASEKEMVAVNTSANPVSTTINGTKLDLGGYEVHWVRT